MRDKSRRKETDSVNACSARIFLRVAKYNYASLATTFLSPSLK